MKFILDENMPLSVRDTLRESGHEVEHIRETSLQGASDFEIANHARKKNAILITKDIEFGSIILYPENAHYGSIV